MLTHSQIWFAVDRLAERYRLSPSGLAKRAGLDATTFNKSKRISTEGKQRWPSTESLSKILQATGASLEDFMALASGTCSVRRIPLIAMTAASAADLFDAAGCPVGDNWDAVTFPDMTDQDCYALEISDDSMAPLYNEGDHVIVAPGAEIRRGDRVVAKTTDGDVIPRIFLRRTAKQVELHAANPAYPARIIPADQIAWVARIVWASQ